MPRTLERAYEVALLREVRALREIVEPYWREAMQRYVSQRADAEPSDPPPPDPRPWLLGAIDRMRRALAAGAWQPSIQFEALASPVIDFAVGRAKGAARIGASSAAVAADRIRRIDAFASPQRAAQIEEWTRRNVSLVTSIPETMLGRLERVVQEHARAGTDPRVLGQLLESTLDVTEARARLIARDQTAKLNSQVQRHAMESSGATAYIWRTVQDQRVREEHAALEGQRFSWTDPPVAGPRGERGHPGMIFQCRCTAEPVYPELDEASLDARLASIGISG